MSSEQWLFVGTALTVIMAFASTVYRERRGSASSQDTMMGVSVKAVSTLRSLNEALQETLDRQSLQLVADRERADRFEVAARPLLNMPDDALPMSQFVTDGWQDLLNDAAAAESNSRVGIYLDDISNRIALGYTVEPTENVSLDRIPTPGVKAARRRRRVAAAAEARRKFDLDPITPPPTEETP